MDDELLCLALCTITETNRVEEMAHVAGCILNRVRAGYRGASVREVVLARMQFSAFNDLAGGVKSGPREALEAQDRDAAVEAYCARRGSVHLFGEAVDICGPVLAQEELESPWLNGQVDHPRAAEVRHYYSPVSMDPRDRVPLWWRDDREVLVPEIPKSRFRWAHSIA